LGFVVTMGTTQQLLLSKRSFWGGLEGEFLSDELLDLLNIPNNMRDTWSRASRRILQATRRDSAAAARS